MLEKKFQSENAIESNHSNSHVMRMHNNLTMHILS